LYESSLINLATANGTFSADIVCTPLLIFEGGIAEPQKFRFNQKYQIIIFLFLFKSSDGPDWSKPYILVPDKKVKIWTLYLKLHYTWVVYRV
jgi:hypothetical protein